MIARNGRPIARLVPTRRARPPRQPGAWKGKGWIADDFDEPDQEMIDLVGNAPLFPAGDLLPATG